MIILPRVDLRSLLIILRADFEFILIDTPAKHYVFPEVPIIVNSSDAVVIVASRQTNRTELIRTIEKLETYNAKILGIISRTDHSELGNYVAGHEEEIKQFIQDEQLV